MPKIVKEIQGGNTFQTSSEGNGLTNSATKTFKIIKNDPSEQLFINDAIGINIGDPYTDNDPIPCVSVEGRMENGSRTVMVVTARFRSTPGGQPSSGGGQGFNKVAGGARGTRPNQEQPDNRSVSPEVRAPTYTMTSSLQQASAPQARRHKDDGSLAPFAHPTNAAGDLMDGLTQLFPVITINITQFSYLDGSEYLDEVGVINSDAFSFSNASFQKHQVMFQGISSTGHVEMFGQQQFRGFKLVFTFAARMLRLEEQVGGSNVVGWDTTAINSGFNIINSGLGDASVDQSHLAKVHNENGEVITPEALVKPGEKVRAMVSIPVPTKEDPAANAKFQQRPSAQPVALDVQGRPLKLDADVGPGIFKYTTQPLKTFGNDFSGFGLNSFF